MPAFSTKEVNAQLKSLPGWSRKGSTIQRTFTFADFLEGIAFVARVAKKAQKMNHHPDIDIRFDEVTLTLSTHDQGGVTDLDFSLARHCDAVFAKI
jgi:4a-hydroxytetrahydrobiopterin dehydratase